MRTVPFKYFHSFPRSRGRNVSLLCFILLQRLDLINPH